MAQIPNPNSELLREPNLLIPGKKPVGAVKLDRNHRYAPNLFCISPNTSTPQELLTATMPVLTGDAHISHRGIETPDAGYDDKCLYTMPFTLNPLSGTFMTGFVNTAASLGWASRLWEMVGTGLNNWGDGGSASTCQVVYLAQGSGSMSLTDSYWTDGLYHVSTTRIIYRQAGSPDHYDTSAYIDDNNQVVTWLPGDGNFDKTGIYIRSNAAANSSPVGYTAFMYGWDYTLSVDAVNDIRRDPYQFLIIA